MRFFNLTCLCLGLAFLLVNCGSGAGSASNSNGADSSTTKSVTTKTADAANDSATHKPDAATGDQQKSSGSEQHETGKLTKVEDGAFPMSNVTIEFPDQKLPAKTFSINLASTKTDDGSLGKWKGKTVEFSYTSKVSPHVYDLRVNGKSLLGKYAPKTDQQWKMTEGTLTGATDLSGDLPSPVAIKDKSGKEFSFEYFVDEEVKKANGKIVNAYYDMESKSEITKISLKK